MPRLKTKEIKFFRGTAGYALLRLKRNEGNLEKLGVESVEKESQKY